MHADSNLPSTFSKPGRSPLGVLRRVSAVGAALVLVVGMGAGPWAAAVAASSGYDIHQGIEKCGDQAHATVQDLWTGTPFYNYGAYIGGAEGTYLSCTSTVAFVNFVKSVGFGMMPIWDDLQAPCTGNAKRMSSNTTTAKNQGITSAHNAQAAMATFGFATYDDVWLDMEMFDESNSSCKAAVHAYIDGWDSVLNAALEAGVYVNHANADSLRLLAHVPDAIWIARWDAEINSVWGFSDIPNTHWENDQRMHQYRGAKTYHLPWGCTVGV